VVQAWKAWRNFWTKAVGFFQLFHAKGPGATQQTLARSGAIEQYVQLLKVLCASLRSACRSLLTTCQPAASVFKIAADLIDPCGTFTWKGLPAQLPYVTQAMAAKKRQQRRSASVGGTERQARHWNVVESSVGWLAVSLTRGVLDLAWTGTCPPPKKQVLSPLRQKAACC